MGSAEQKGDVRTEVAAVRKWGGEQKKNVFMLMKNAYNAGKTVAKTTTTTSNITAIAIRTTVAVAATCGGNNYGNGGTARRQHTRS